METAPRATSGGGKRVTAHKLTGFPLLAAALIRLHHATCHFTIVGREYEEEAFRVGKAPIFTSWHFAFPSVIYHFRDRKGMVMVSRSRDGEWIARILKHLGFESARGSPGKGGGAALRRLISHMKEGYPTGLIADGSQGPPLVAQKGILILAKRTQSPLLPVSLAASPCWRFRSWDRTLLPMPFSRVVLVYGTPIWVESDASPEELERLRGNLERTMNRLTEDAERILREKGRH